MGNAADHKGKKDSKLPDVSIVKMERPAPWPPPPSTALDRLRKTRSLIATFWGAMKIVAGEVVGPDYEARALARQELEFLFKDQSVLVQCLVGNATVLACCQQNRHDRGIAELANLILDLHETHIAMVSNHNHERPGFRS